MASKKKLKILIVEDIESMRDSLKMILNALGYTDITEAEDGEVGFAMFECLEDLDLIISDINMPNMDGISMLQLIRKTNKKIPILMVTTESEFAIVAKCIKLGATNYIVKPYKEETIMEKIDKIFV